MTKRIVTVALAFMLCITGLGYGSIEIHAQEEQGEDIDFSYLMNDSALIGYADLRTKGVYLMDGTSVINKIGSDTIGAGGSTTAAYRCTVTTTSIVERYVNGKWARVTSWTQTNQNAFSATVSKSLIVATDNIYRVRSSHYAASDYSSSYTNGLIM